ncbi:MAG TPA: M23 family metallopeptidase [Candidatus Cloacimonetes bacterium]|nr:M23 family metallopeptidase [Candidatus Cloacimonadota bacterium]
MKFLIFILLISFSFPFFSEEFLILSGNATQGGILIGNVHQDVEQVFWNEKNLAISDQKIIIGFDRDEPLEHQISLIFKNGEIIKKDFLISKREYEIQRIDKIKKEYVEKPVDKNLLRRISNESKSLQAVRSGIYKENDIMFEEFIRPIEEGKISGVFGSQRILNGIPKSPHSGLDIAAPKGTPVKAMSNGIVALIGDYFYNGKFVLIDHGLGLSSIYIHLDSIAVELGQNVEIGEQIGSVGSTGRATGPHLHWGVNYFKKRIDPELLLDQDEKFLIIKK